MLNLIKLSFAFLFFYAHPVFGSEKTITLFGFELFSSVNEYFSNAELIGKVPHYESNNNYFQLSTGNPPIRNPVFQEYDVIFDENNIIHQIGAWASVFELGFCMGAAEQWRYAFEGRFGGYLQYWEGDGGGGIYMRSYDEGYEDFFAAVSCNQYKDGTVALVVFLRSYDLSDAISAFYDAF